MSRVCQITPRASRGIEAITGYFAAQSDLNRAERFLNAIDSTHYFMFCGLILRWLRLIGLAPSV
jgi:hypothetical protein